MYYYYYYHYHYQQHTILGGTLPWTAGTLEPLAYITTVSQPILY